MNFDTWFEINKINEKVTEEQRDIFEECWKTSNYLSEQVEESYEIQIESLHDEMKDLKEQIKKLQEELNGKNRENKKLVE